MIELLENFETTQDFMKKLNKLRKANKNRWIAYSGFVAGKAVRIKGFETGWLQILEVDGVRYPAPMEMSVKQWVETIARAIGDGV